MSRWDGHVKMTKEDRREWSRMYYWAHKDVMNKYHVAYYRENAAALRARKTARDGELRHAAEDLYGARCAACQNPDRRVLVFHHIMGRKGEVAGATFYRRILREHPKDIVLLCANDHALRHLT